MNLPPRWREGKAIRTRGRRRYRVHEHLAAGGFGRAYRVRRAGGRGGDLCLKATYDVASWARELNWYDVFRRDDRVVRLLDRFVIPDRRGEVYVLVLEFAPYGSLWDQVELEGPYPERRAVREVLALLHTLQKLHAIGGIHRDITPFNILVFEGGKLKYSDFGITRQRIADQRRVPAWTFNSDWVPSEVRRARVATVQSDLYQMGLLLYFLLTGQDRPPRRDRAEAIEAMQCSTALKAVVARAFAVPEHRYQDVSGMIRDLRRALGPRASLRFPLYLYGLVRGEVAHRARMLHDGRVQVLGGGTVTEHASPAAAAEAVLGYRASGWSFWHVRDTGWYYPLASIRRRLVASVRGRSQARGGNGDG